MIYFVEGLGGSGAGLAGGANEPLAVLWNPATTHRIKVFRIACFWVADSQTTPTSISRTTTRGTPGSTVTPDGDNSEQADSVPPSGALLDLATYTGTLPVVATPVLLAAHVPQGGKADGFDLPIPRGIVVPPGTGLGITKPVGEGLAGPWSVIYEFED